MKSGGGDQRDGRSPSLKRVVLEDLEDGHDRRSLSTQDAQNLLGAATEDALDASHAKAVDDVLRETEGHGLGNGQALALRSHVSA